jgi:membrane-associated phospholipid phosphatase
MQKLNKRSTVLKALDTSVTAFTLLIFILTIIFHAKVENWMNVAATFLLGAVVYYLLSSLTQRFTGPIWRIFSRSLLTAASTGFLFSEIRYVQHIFVDGWMDQHLVNFDVWLMGIESTIALQKITIPIVTEGMMFAYTAYVPFIVLVALFCYWKSGVAGAEEYMLNLMLAYIVCYIWFLIFPIAGPLFHQKELYTVPLQGGIFTWFGEWIRHNAHYPGGNFPSPHCAAGTIMLISLYRYNRKVYFVLLPIIILLYISTVYGRYHFAMDGVTGILTAFLVVKASPKFVRYFSYKNIGIN